MIPVFEWSDFGSPLYHCFVLQDPEEEDRYNRLIHKSKVTVMIPVDRTQLCLINRMVEFVIREGPMFEAMIMNREMNNRIFHFLFDNQSPEHVYYRWRLYSLLQVRIYSYLSSLKQELNMPGLCTLNANAM